MSSALSAMNFADDFQEARACDDATRWTIVAGAEPLEIDVIMTSAKQTSETFHVRFLWTVYPDSPPSMKFRDPASGRLDLPSAWPVGGPFRPESLCACTNYTAEGFAMHAEWVNDPNLRWDRRGNVLLKVIRLVQDDLDNHFIRRFGQ